ncbi:hypothetical protein BC830DRAFT_299254 [Chytriomyces sp. MP71]|nr:hypothetical protein BC830DRAFT_299254 [Chytriomyces sp. MP71]
MAARSRRGPVRRRFSRQPLRQPPPTTATTTSRTLTKKRRNTVKHGYTDSDDEDGGFDSDADSNPGNDNDRTAREQNEDDDMFAEPALADDDEVPPDAAKNPASIRYLTRDKIQSVGEEEAEPEETFDTAGIAIEPFHMKQEMEEGGFDENFNFIRARDEHDMHDRWLGGISGDEIRRAKVVSERMKARVDARDALIAEEEREAGASFGSENECWRGVLEFMKVKESVTAALKRLGGPKKVPAWKKNQRKKPWDSASASAAGEETQEAAQLRKKQLADLIALTDKLTGLGRYDVMEQSYESISRALRIANILPDTWQHGDPIPSPPTSSRRTAQLLWEYKPSALSEEIRGPFPGVQMQRWKDAGALDVAAVVRLIGVNTPVDPRKGFVPCGEVEFGTAAGVAL